LDIAKLQISLENEKIETNIVSDHGVHNYQSNFGLVISSKSEVFTTNKVKIYSITFHEPSYHSELFVILAALVSLRHIISSCNITIPRQKDIFLYCDNKSVVQTINSRLEVRRTMNQHRHPDVDIEQQTIREIQMVNDKKCTIIILHVKGHQDTVKKRQLRTEEALNVEADEVTLRQEYFPMSSNTQNSQ
jgi:ribonuclease HI